MKINDLFVLNQIGDEYLVVPTGEKKFGFEAVFKLNNTAKFIWETLATETDEESLIEAFAEKFGLAKDIAEKDVTEFLIFLKEKGILE